METVQMIKTVGIDGEKIYSAWIGKKVSLPAWDLGIEGKRDDNAKLESLVQSNPDCSLIKI